MSILHNSPVADPLEKTSSKTDSRAQSFSAMRASIKLTSSRAPLNVAGLRLKQQANALSIPSNPRYSRQSEVPAIKVVKWSHEEFAPAFEARSWDFWFLRWPIRLAFLPLSNTSTSEASVTASNPELTSCKERCDGHSDHNDPMKLCSQLVLTSWLV